jgi:hypothetical protein
VPVEQLRVRLIDQSARHGDGAAGEALVLAAVVKIVERVAESRLDRLRERGQAREATIGVSRRPAGPTA